MGKPLMLSIVIPVYNEEDHLKACLDSIAKQTVMPDEVIIVDNNSTDKSLEIAKEYKFVRVVKEKQQGKPFARTKGFNEVKSRFIGRIDADSVLPPGWCESMLAFLRKSPDNLITGGCYMYDLRIGKLAGWVNSQVAFRMNRLIMGHYIAFGSNMAFSKKLWDEVKDELHNDLDIHEDLDLAIHLHRHGYKIEYHAGLKVGVDTRVLTTRTRDTQMEYLMMWPNTLYKHGLRRAWIGLIGAYFLYYVLYYPLIGMHKVIDFVKH